ncbi:hypothetical protein AVEN_258760-1 [Araneus ventricosus]|uniref:Uncharacterized protein n=1 Tax=Araneus ventricosus TaxID=182803 RepID=A0A4Y2D2H5_ARAVE|nr:hypothetical protein AVEN_258760-1 [Araneus ventricosus]
MTRTTPELAPPSPNFRATPTGGRLATTYDLACNRPHTRRIFSGIGFRTCDPPVPRGTKNLLTFTTTSHSRIRNATLEDEVLDKTIRSIHPGTTRLMILKGRTTADDNTGTVLCIKQPSPVHAQTPPKGRTHVVGVGVVNQEKQPFPPRRSEYPLTVLINFSSTYLWCPRLPTGNMALGNERQSPLWHLAAVSI